MSDFLGVGWTSPVRLDSNGYVVPTETDEAVRQSIWMILSTAPGERLMRPDFGCGIHDLVFSPNSASTIGQIVNDVQRSLIDWEPRIDVLSVEAVPNNDTLYDNGQPTCLMIQINYRVRTTNNRFNLVYPFYLE